MTSARLSRRPAAHMLGAAALMGSWAAFANRAHPMPEPLFAFLVQGALSGTITLGLKRGIETAVARLAAPWARIVPPIGAALLSITLLTLVHTLAGTPEIAATIAVPLTAVTLYAALYAASLVADRRTAP